MKFSAIFKTTLFSAFLISSTWLNIYTIRLILKEQQEQQKTQSMRLKRQLASQPPVPSSASPVLYRTKNGDKYHYDPHCSNHEYLVCSWQEVQTLRLQPCKKCVK